LLFIFWNLTPVGTIVIIQYLCIYVWLISFSLVAFSSCCSMCQNFLLRLKNILMDVWNLSIYCWTLGFFHLFCLNYFFLYLFLCYYYNWLMGCFFIPWITTHSYLRFGQCFLTCSYFFWEGALSIITWYSRFNIYLLYTLALESTIPPVNHETFFCTVFRKHDRKTFWVEIMKTIYLLNKKEVWRMD
jgi:hypothetical protein